MSGSVAFAGRHYTLERDNRELQPAFFIDLKTANYTLERDNRELQLSPYRILKRENYTLERDNRELQRKYRKSNR